MTRLGKELQEALYDAKSRARKQAQRVKHGATVVTGKNLLSWFKEQPAKVQKQVQALIAAKPEPLLLYPAREVIIPNTPAQRIQGLRDLMDEYISKGLTFEDFFAGLKGVYRAKSGYVTYGFGMPDQIKKDLIELGYVPNLKKIWFEQLKQEEPQEVPEFRASSAGIDRSLAARSHAFSSYVPEVRARQEIEGFQASVQDTYERLKRYAKTPAQQELLNAEMERFQAGLASKENAVLAAKGRTASSMITGASNFPTARNRRALETEQRRYEELKAFEERAEKAIKRELKKLAIEEQGGELQALKNKIEAAKDKQEKFKQINRIIRKKLPADETVKMLIDSMNLSEATARKLITGDTKWDIGVPQYELTNNLANIRRMEQRVKELESKEATPTTKKELTMGRIVDNADEDRVQIFFNEKPDESIRAKLKAHGWRWSPSSKAWQRKRTQAALQSANELMYDPAPRKESDYKAFESVRLDAYIEAYGSEKAAKSAIKKAYLAVKRKEKDVSLKLNDPAPRQMTFEGDASDEFIQFKDWRWEEHTPAERLKNTAYSYTFRLPNKAQKTYAQAYIRFLEGKRKEPEPVGLTSKIAGKIRHELEYYNTYLKTGFISFSFYDEGEEKKAAYRKEFPLDPAPRHEVKRCLPGIEAALRRKGIETDTIDIKEEIDSTLPCDQNKELILAKFGARKTDKYSEAARKAAQYYQGTGKLARASPQERAAAFAAMREAGTLRGYDIDRAKLDKGKYKYIFLIQPSKQKVNIKADNLIEAKEKFQFFYPKVSWLDYKLKSSTEPAGTTLRGYDPSTWEKSPDPFGDKTKKHVWRKGNLYVRLGTMPFSKKWYLRVDEIVNGTDVVKYDQVLTLQESRAIKSAQEIMSKL